MNAPAHSHSLQALRKNLLSALTWLGIANLIAIVAGAVLISFALDWLFELPWVLRAAAIVAVAIVYVRAVRLNHRRLRVQVPPGDLLVTVERSHPALEGQLLTAVELGNELRARENEGGAGVLLRRAADESRRALRRVAVDQSLHLAPVRRRTLLATGLAAAVVLLGICFPETFFFWGRRNILLSTMPWPRRTHFALEREGPVWHHPRRDPLHIEGWVLGSIPRSVDLHLASDGESRTTRLVPGMEATREFTLASETVHGGPRPGESAPGKKLAYVLPRVMEPFEFSFSGGDNSSLPVRVEVHDRPRIASTRVTLRFPTHIGQEARVVENPAREVSAIQGTEIEVEIAADQTIGEAWTRFGDEARRPATDVEDQTLRHSFKLMESGFLEIGLRGGPWSFEARPMRLAFAAFPDMTPRVTLAIDGDERVVTPDGRIAYTVEAEDDYGFTEISLEVTRPTPRADAGRARGALLEDVEASPAGEGDSAPRQETLKIDLAPWTPERGEDGVETSIARVLELAPVALEPGTQFTLQAIAVDNDAPGGLKSGRSALETFIVMAPAELLERLDRLRTEAQTHLEELAFDERRIAGDVGRQWAAGPRGELEPRSTRRDGQPEGERAAGDEQTAPERPSEAAAAPSGQPQSGQPQSGQPQSGQPQSGQPQSGQPQSGQPQSGQPQSGQPQSGQPQSGQPQSGQPQSGQPQSGQPQSGQPQSGEPQSGQPQSGQPQSGQPQSGQPQSGQPQAGQPQAQQPQSGERRQDSPREPEALSREQEEVAREAEDVARRLQEIRRSLERNRLAGPEELRRFDEEVARPLDDLTDDRLPRSARDLAGLPRDDSPEEARREAREEIEAIAKELDLLARRLEGTRKFREVLDRLKIIVELQGDVIDETQKEIDR